MRTTLRPTRHRKLSLRKETLRKLEGLLDGELRAVAGGAAGRYTPFCQDRDG